jgi:cell fate regulator YaaT (PSP1 superfamily)
VLRIANEKDFKKLEENKAKESEAFSICEEMILEHKLDMKLVSVEYSFDGSRIVFFFTSDGRVDFRELVKDLAARFHTRIELRQIGVRDEAKMLGGLGICGQPYCCKRFLNDFQTVSIKMAKEQGLSLNPTKVSGSCGRLMCCLKYEQNAYEHLNSITPRVGSTVKTREGLAIVTDVNLITGNLFVKNVDSDSIPYKIHRDEVKLVSKNKKPSKEANAEEN